MTSFYSQITVSLLSEKDLEIFHSLSQETYGRELAGKVAGKFTLGEVNDGTEPYPVLITFESQEEVVEWVAHQSDQTMSLCSRHSFNNQTISRIRLEYFLEDDYDPVWNSYCAYVSKRSQQ